jgi:hypothetical protein
MRKKSYGKVAVFLRPSKIFLRAVISIDSPLLFNGYATGWEIPDWPKCMQIDVI